jgi:hypothetical protein
LASRTGNFSIFEVAILLRLENWEVELFKKPKLQIIVSGWQGLNHRCFLPRFSIVYMFTFAATYRDEFLWNDIFSGMSSP